MIKKHIVPKDLKTSGWYCNCNNMAPLQHVPSCPMSNYVDTVDVIIKQNEIIDFINNLNKKT